MSVWLLSPVATDRIGNATALDLAEGETSWPYIYICYTHIVDGYADKFVGKKEKRKKRP